MMRIDTVLGIVLALAVGGLVQPVRAQEAKHLFFEGDMVRGAQQGAPGPFCVLDSQFKHLEKVVWRIRVLDSAGKPLDGSGLKGVVVELPDGQKVDAKYGQHPPPSQGPAADYFWSAIWIIPTSYPTGSLSYKVTATDLDGNAQTWEPFKTKPARLTVVDGEIEIKKPQ
jgi:hypothetical protein